MQQKRSIKLTLKLTLQYLSHLQNNNEKQFLDKSHLSPLFQTFDVFIHTGLRIFGKIVVPGTIRKSQQIQGMDRSCGSQSFVVQNPKT